MTGLKNKVISFLACLFVCYLTAAIGAIASLDAPVYYNELIKPVWSPSASIFGPMWSTLYTLMALSLWLIYSSKHIHRRQRCFFIFFIQLCLNALWSWLFFKWNMGLGSFIEITILLICIFINIIEFLKVNKLAGVLLIPYFTWVAFATFLTYTLWRLNPIKLG